MTRILAISNQKGGVGKTTTAINLAAALAESGLRVLLVDLDPQGNASSGLGLPKQAATMGSLDLMLGWRELRSVLQPTAFDRLQLVPATSELVGAEIELAGAPRRELRLRDALRNAPLDYSWVLLDCPPSLGLLTVNALAAADGMLVPVQAEYYAMEGLGALLRTLAQVRKAVNPLLERDGILLTLHDSRNRLCREVEAQLRRVFGREVFQAVIPRNVRLAEAPSHGRPVLAYDPDCRGSRAYRQLAAELLARLAPASARREAS